MPVAINTRALGAPVSGVQRYTLELLARLPAEWRRLAPAGRASGAVGHAWEQCVLPRLAAGDVLFSPANTGPLAHPRQVVTMHDLSVFDHPEAFSGAFGRWYRALLPRLARRAAAIVTDSDFSKGRIVDRLGVPSSRVHAIPLGVATPPVPPPSDVAQATLRRLGVPSPFLLFVGSDDPRKNVRGLVEGFGRAAVPGLTLVVAGGGNARVFAADGGSATPASGARVLRLGHVDDATLEVLYREAAGFVFASLYEGFGLPPLEAMARGCPVACAAATSLPEVVGPDLAAGGAALLFDPRDPDAIARAIVALHALTPDERRTMIDRGRDRAARFTWERCADATRRVLERVAS